MIRRFLSVASCTSLLLVGAAASLHAEPKPEEIYQKVLPSVMVLEIENDLGERFVGSAVLALGDDVAVTAWHVVCDARKVWASFSDGQRVAVLGCIDKDPSRDLAAIRLAQRFPKRKATLNQELQSIAARAYVIGAPKGYGFSISDGLISQIRHVDGFPQYQVSCPISSGNSGGPVLNARGQVVGIASWTKADAQNVSFAIPSSEFSRLNVSRRTTPWEQLPKPVPPSLVRTSPPRPVRDEGTAGGYDELRQRLEQSSGKPVTVIVRENGQESRYSFIVPTSPK